MMKHWRPGVHCRETSTTPPGWGWVPEPEEVSGVGPGKERRAQSPTACLSCFRDWKQSQDAATCLTCGCVCGKRIHGEMPWGLAGTESPVIARVVGKESPGMLLSARAVERSFSKKQSL